MTTNLKAAGFKNDEGYYVLRYRIDYHSDRYGKDKTVPIGYPADGGSGPAVDIYSDGWWVHDSMCPERDRFKWPRCAVGFWETDGFFDDGTPVTVWQASTVLHDILLAEGRWFRARTWFLATLVAGKWREWFSR